MFSFSKKSLYRITTEHFSAAGLRRFVVVRGSSDFKELYSRLQRLAEYRKRLPSVPTSASIARSGASADVVSVRRRKSTSDLRTEVGSTKAIALEMWLKEVVGIAWNSTAVRKFLNRVDDDEVMRAEAMAEARGRDRAVSAGAGVGAPPGT